MIKPTTRFTIHRLLQPSASVSVLWPRLLNNFILITAKPVRFLFYFFIFYFSVFSPHCSPFFSSLPTYNRKQWRYLAKYRNFKKNSSFFGEFFQPMLILSTAFANMAEELTICGSLILPSVSLSETSNWIFCHWRLYSLLNSKLDLILALLLLDKFYREGMEKIFGLYMIWKLLQFLGM